MTLRTHRGTHRLVALVVPAAIAAVALAGCASSGGPAPAGGSSDSSSSSTTTSATTTSTTSSPTSSASSSSAGKAAALVPTSIKNKGTLTFALDASYPPDESIDTDGKTIVGMDADLAKALAAKLGLTASLVDAKFATIIPGLQGGKFDVGMSSFTDTKDREKTVDFVDYFKAGEGFYTKAGSSTTFNGVASLCDHTVAVEAGTVEETEAQDQGKKCKVTVLSFDDQSAANLAVSSGRAEVGFADSQVAAYIVKQSSGQFQLSGKAFEVAPYGIALPQGNGMAKAVQAALKELSADGTYLQILKHWGLQTGAVKTFTINGAIS